MLIRCERGWFYLAIRAGRYLLAIEHTRSLPLCRQGHGCPIYGVGSFTQIIL
ncbi:MAG: protein of unknown function DUF4752 [Siphoviridae sp. cttb18]|nr:MAG: protein of unknown function DUF4752 [Siphoviridae sp. cttb18]